MEHSDGNKAESANSPLQRFVLAIRKLVWIIGSRALGSILQFGVAALVSNYAPWEILGGYYLYLSWAMFLAPLIGCGQPLALLNLSSRIDDHGSTSPMLHYLSRFLMQTAAISIVLFGAVMVLRGFGAGFNGGFDITGDTWVIITCSMVSGGLLAAIRLSSDVRRGLRKPDVALFIEHSAVNILFLMAIVYAVSTKTEITLQGLLVSHIVCQLIVAILSLAVLYLGRRPSHEADLQTVPAPRIVYPAFWTSMVATRVFLVLPYWILPIFATRSEVGQFGVVHRLVGITGSLIAALQSWFAPLFAKSKEEAFSPGSLISFRKAQFFTVLLVLPVAIAYLTFPATILRLFGEPEPAMVSLLMVMAILRLLACAGGLPDLYVAMTGNGRVDALASTLGIVVFFCVSVANSWYSPIFVTGIACGASLIARNYGNWLFIETSAYRCRRESRRSVSFGA